LNYIHSSVMASVCSCCSDLLNGRNRRPKETGRGKDDLQIADALVEHFGGRVDIFINNAADSRPGTLGELKVEEIRESMISNIQTPVLIVDELVKRKMFQSESRIIYISSVRSRQPWSMQLMYAAGKSAGESLCRTWSQAFGGREENVSGIVFACFKNIPFRSHETVINYQVCTALLIIIQFSFMAGTTANAVTVGLTQTDSVMQCPPDAPETFKQELITLQSIPKFGQPEDVADVVGLLCSRDARWITGCVVSASGGGIKIG
jgi:3-oxoacyl-[acyl-carrier protein] reductase